MPASRWSWASSVRGRSSATVSQARQVRCCCSSSHCCATGLEGTSRRRVLHDTDEAPWGAAPCRRAADCGTSVGEDAVANTRLRLRAGRCWPAMKTWIARRPVTAYVLLTFVLTWAMWLPLLAQTQGWISGSPQPVLHLLGSLGPAVAGIAVIAALH